MYTLKLKMNMNCFNYYAWNNVFNLLPMVVNATRKMRSGSSWTSNNNLRHWLRHHVGSGSRQSQSRNPKQDLTVTDVLVRSLRRYNQTHFDALVADCLASLLVQEAACVSNRPFCSTSHDYTNQEDFGPRSAADWGHSQRRQREGVRRWGGGGSPRRGGGRRLERLEGHQADTDGGSVAAGPQGPRGRSWF